MFEGSSPGRGWEFSPHHRVETGSEAHPTLHHLVPTSKKAWSYTFTPPMRLHGVVLI